MARDRSGAARKASRSTRRSSEFFEKQFHRVMAGGDGFDIGERRRQPRCQFARARRRDAAVNRGQQAAAARARQRFGQFQIAPRRQRQSP